MRRILLVAALALLAMLCWTFLRDAKLERPARETTLADKTLSTPKSEELSTPLVSPDQQSDRVSAESAPIAQPLPTRGTIVVLDTNGGEHASESGVVTLRVPGTPGKSVQEFDLSVANGGWDTAATPDLDCFVVRIVLGGREARLEGDRATKVKAHEAMALRARWVASTMLHVVDANTGAELDGVRLVRMDEMWSEQIEIPMESYEAKDFAANLQSPIPIDPKFEVGSGKFTIFAHRHDYGWGSLSIDPTGGGDQYIKLEPGADLSVKLTGGVPAAGVIVRIWRRNAGGLERYYDLSPKGGGLTSTGGVVPGIRAGEYEVRLEHGEPESAKILARATVTIVGGQNASVELAVPLAPADKFVSVVVVVKLDSTWNLEQFIVRVADLDLQTTAPGRSTSLKKRSMQEREPGVFASKPMKLRVGKHQLFLVEACFGVECEVTEDEPQEVTMVVPPCGLVLVTVIDARTGELIEKPYVDFTYAGNSTSGGQGSSIKAPEGPGPVELRAPIGKIRLSVNGDSRSDYLAEYPTVEVAPGIQEIIVELKHARTINIVLREGERPVDGSTGMMGLKVSDARGPVSPPRVSLDSNGKLSVSLHDAGRYVLALPKLPGFMPIPDVDVDLTTQESADVVIQLVRAQ